MKKKLYNGTKLQLVTPGRIRKFPRALINRFVLPTTAEYEFGTYPGSIITSKVKNGSKYLPTDILPILNDHLIIKIKNQRDVSDPNCHF